MLSCYIIHSRILKINDKIMLKIQKICGEKDRFGTSTVRRFIYPEKAFSLPVELRAIGTHYISSHEYSWDGSLRGEGNGEHALLQYTLSGQGAVDWEGKTYDVPPGHAMLLTFPEPHRYFLPAESRHWEVFYASFSGRAAWELIRELRSRFGVVVPVSPEGKTISSMRRLLNSDLPGSAWDSASEAYRLLMRLGDELERHLTDNRPAAMEQVLDYCRNHLDGDLTVDVLAEVAGYSRWHFSREFKKVQGVTVPQFVLELRLQQAAEVLRLTQYSVKEIAQMCGFRNTAYFIRCFSEAFGVTPGTYRKRN